MQGAGRYSRLLSSFSTAFIFPRGVLDSSCFGNIIDRVAGGWFVGKDESFGECFALD